jgi:hypothetical protein
MHLHFMPYQTTSLHMNIYEISLSKANIMLWKKNILLISNPIYNLRSY